MQILTKSCYTSKRLNIMSNPIETLKSGRIDPATLMRIKNLQVRAKSVVDGFYNGLHRSPLHGFSVEFSEYRPYSNGDDLRGLDWKLFGRTDRYYIKKFEDETNRRCYLAVDNSRSMGYGSLGYTKSDYARTMAATLAYYFALQRDAVGLLTFEDKVIDFIGARHRPGHFQRILAALDRPPQGNQTDLLGPLAELAELVRHRGLVILISDLLVPLEQLRSRFAFLRARRHEVMVLRILDPTEVEFQFDSPVMMVDMETKRELFVDPGHARQRYQRAFAEHNDQLKNIFAELGIDWTTLIIDQPLDTALFNFLAVHSN
jgi:uncharacterized protein (DUF58 family)